MYFERLLPFNGGSLFSREPRFLGVTASSIQAGHPFQPPRSWTRAMTYFPQRAPSTFTYHKGSGNSFLCSQESVEKYILDTSHATERFPSVRLLRLNTVHFRTSSLVISTSLDRLSAVPGFLRSTCCSGKNIGPSGRILPRTCGTKIAKIRKSVKPSLRSDSELCANSSNACSRKT